jgi:hypothetical protein
MTLRAKVDARYTANVLLGLSNTSCGSASSLEKGKSGLIKSSSSVCRDLDKLTEKHRMEILSQQQEIEDNQNSLLQQCTIQQQIRKKIELQMSEAAAEQNEAFNAQLDGVEDAILGNGVSGTSGGNKRGGNGNGRGKYTPQERESVRRERNRIHAKKTRDKKKIFLESSEKIICSLEQDVHTLREYLLQFNLISAEEVARLTEKDRLARAQLQTLKESSFDISTMTGIGSPISNINNNKSDGGASELIDIEDMEGSAAFLNQLRSSFNKDGSNNGNGPANVQNRSSGSIQSGNSGNTSPPMDSGNSSQNNSNQDSGNSNGNSNQDSGADDSDGEDNDSATGTATSTSLESVENFEVSVPRRRVKKRKGVSNDTFTISIEVKSKRERSRGGGDSTDGSIESNSGGMIEDKVASLTSLQHHDVVEA